MMTSLPLVFSMQADRSEGIVLEGLQDNSGYFKKDFQR
jgi:hypothetical protein